MKKQILKIAGVKSEKEFYKKFPDEASFMAKHGKALKKAQIGAYMTSEAPPTTYQPIDVRGMYDELDYQLTGMTDVERKKLEALKQSSGKSEYSVGKSGKKLKKAQPGISEPPGPDYTWDPYMNDWVYGGMSYSQMGSKGTPAVPMLNTMGQMVGGVASTGKTGPGTGVNPGGTPNAAAGPKLDNTGTYVQAGLDVMQGLSMIKQQQDAVREAEQTAKLAGVMSGAAASVPRQSIRRRYVRPEDAAFQPEQMFPTYGVGTNVLAKFGASVGGGEIANTFAPNTLYDDLGYEPLNESERYKQFVSGGRIPKAEGGWNITDDQFSNFMTNQGGSQLVGGLGNMITGSEVEAGNKIGKGIGTAAGTAIGGPIGGAVGGLLGSAVGGLIDRSEEKIKKYQNQSRQYMGNVIGRNVGTGLQRQYSRYMEDGGTTSPYAWMSHTWQPQVITTFGEHKMKDLLKPPHDAEMLRAGGHLKEYTPPSATAMSTERPMMQMGGELQTHWGGYAEPMSYNPYLPDGGETVMFRGQSHDESDGRGNTGIGITYGENPVEVERGEPAMKLKDGGTGDSNLTVFGNIKITNGFANMLGDPKSKGKKFKTYVADLSKQENKQNKLMEKSVEKLDDLNVLTSFDKLAFGTLQANIEGANAKLKDLAEKKMNAAALQNAINDTKEEDLLEVTDRGDVKARKGASIPKAQSGGRVSDADYKELRTLYDKANKEKYGTSVLEFQRKFHKLFPNEAKQIIAKMGPTSRAQKEFKGDVTKLEGNEDMYFGPRTKQYMATAEKIFGELPRTTVGIPGDKKITVLPPMTPSATPSKTIAPTMVAPKKTNLIPYINEALRYLRPSDVEQLDPNQLIGEMYALATNQLEPVAAQTFQPELGVPYDISLQDILNENEASFRAQQRMIGYNPAFQGQLSAQKYQANQKVLGEQFRLNQAEKQRVYEQNRNLLNQSKLQNLGILDQQYVRQQEALSKTKATTQAALSSIASKYAQNKLENRTLATMENLYNYRYDPKFRAINMNPLAQWDTDIDGVAAAGTPQAPEGYEYETILKKKKKDSGAKNGAILKAIKNL